MPHKMTVIIPDVFKVRKINSPVLEKWTSLEWTKQNPVSARRQGLWGPGPLGPPSGPPGPPSPCLECWEGQSFTFPVLNVFSFPRSWARVYILWLLLLSIGSLKVKVKLLSLAWLFATPWTVACTKLLRPWDFPGKNTGVGCHSECYLYTRKYNEIPSDQHNNIINHLLIYGFGNVRKFSHEVWRRKFTRDKHGSSCSLVKRSTWHRRTRQIGCLGKLCPIWNSWTIKWQRNSKGWNWKVERARL